eukprot:3114134-Pyramimonas_sp.AAC.1
MGCEFNVCVITWTFLAGRRMRGKASRGFAPTAVPSLSCQTSCEITGDDCPCGRPLRTRAIII